MAIQLIINKELGLKNENPIQGSFIIEELTDLVEEAVLQEFDRITERGVLEQWKPCTNVLNSGRKFVL
jgi:methylmalonyl-CoA mutase